MKFWQGGAGPLIAVQPKYVDEPGFDVLAAIIAAVQCRHEKVFPPGPEWVDCPDCGARLRNESTP